MCVCMHFCFVENHPIWILEDWPLISEVVLSQTKSEALSLHGMFVHLIAFEARRLQHQADIQLQFGTSANYVGRGCGCGDRGHGGRSCDRTTSGRGPTPGSTWAILDEVRTQLTHKYNTMY
jgi:hypothetical protein